MKSKIFYALFFSILTVCESFSQTAINWRLIETLYDSEDICVAGYTDADHSGIDKTGSNNSRAAIQELLNNLSNAGGGVLYLSAGKYKVDGGGLVIPKGVVLRGDWKKPSKDAPLEGGTILMAYNGRDRETEGNSFIIMEPSTGLYDVAIWYPEQIAGSIVPYPPTVLYGRSGVWGNDYCNVRNVTFVNSYTAIALSRNNGGGCPNIFNIYGSPLSRGIEIDNIADVGRFDWLDFSPDYWAASGLDGAPAKDGPHKKFIKENATAVVMRRNDWSYTCNLTVDGYHTGFYAGMSKVTNDSSTPNGHNYNFTLTNCTEGICLDAVSGAGIMFTTIRINNCDNGIVVTENAGGSTVQFYDCEISALKEAISISEKTSLKLMTQQSKILKGEVNIKGGIYTSVDGDFNNEPPQITAGTNGRLLLSGNRFAKPEAINNKSLFTSAIDHQAVSIKPLPEFPETKPRETKPARNALYVITDTQFGGKANIILGTSQTRWTVIDANFDNTNAIQNALDKAGAEGGGIVFIPPGKYRVNGNLTVPTGVELKGASDLASVPKGQGTIIEIYAGKDEPNGEPFLKLSENSGIRGISFNYPEQKSSLTKNPATLPQYPYCLQAAGNNVYIVNVGVRATYNGIDLFTYKCDNHYVDYFAGHVFKNAIRVGGGSSNGLISNYQFNSLVMAAGFEWPKFGGWPNSEDEQASKDAVYSQNWKELEFLILEDCTDQLLYNNFHYDSHKGIIFGANGTAPSGLCMGLGLDASLRSICFEGLDPDKGFDLINTQVVSVSRNEYANTTYLETSPTFTGEVNMFSSDYWGNSRYAGTFGGGTINLMLPHFQQYGSTRFLQIDGNAEIYISTSDVNATNFVNSGKAGQVSVESSVVALSSPSGYRSWWNNLGVSPALQSGATLNREGWIATANISNAPPNNAIDGQATTRWDTSGSQTPGQWFAVDTRQPVKFNIIILDTSGSSNDGPAGYEVYVSNDGTNWGSPIATGTQGSSVLIINLPETVSRYIKIVQTGNKSNYWSIHEFYLAFIDNGEECDCEDEDCKCNTTSTPELINELSKYIPFLDGDKNLHFVDEGQLSANTAIRVYNIAGLLVQTSAYSGSEISLSHLPTGVYIVVLESGNIRMSWKMVIQ